MTRQVYSQMQTVEIHHPRAPFCVFGMEVAPVLEFELSSDDTPVRVTRQDGSKVHWYPNGNVQMNMTDGTCKVWYRRPTLQDAVKSNAAGRKFFQFNRDGSLISYLAGSPYYWGPPIVVEPVSGTVEYSYEHPRDGWIFESDECDCGDCPHCRGCHGSRCYCLRD